MPGEEMDEIRRVTHWFYRTLMLALMLGAVATAAQGACKPSPEGARLAINAAGNGAT